MEIELRNVGIIKSAHLQFVQGLNLIVGASSSGKSTLLRAIRAMMDNSFSDSNITYGQKKLAVRIKYKDHSATYIRDLENTNRKSAYQIDGKVYTKIGRTSLDDLSNLFKLAPVEIDGEKINFNFSAQFSGPFLLLGSASLLYSILTYRSSFDITKMNDLYATDLKNTKKELDVLIKTRNTLTGEKEKKEKELKKLESVPDVYTKVLLLKNQNEAYNKMKILYMSYLSSLQLRETIKHRLLSMSKIIESLKGYNESYTVYRNLYLYCNSLESLRNTKNRTLSIQEILKQSNTYISLYAQTRLLNDYCRAKSKLQNNRLTLHTLHIPSMNVLLLLHTYLMKQKDLLNIQAELQDIKESLNTVTKRIKDVGVCPLCQQPLCNC